MIDLAIASRIAHDLTKRQFAPGPRRATPPAAAVTPATEPRAPVRRAGARVLRALADRVEPAPRCAPQA
jgi:hypothetical protein